MSEIEALLLAYYRAEPVEALTEQEKDEYIYLLIKEGLERWQKGQHSFAVLSIPPAS